MKNAWKLLVLSMLVVFFTLTFAPCQSASAGASNLTCVITRDKASIMSGEPITATWTISGGTAPYHLTFCAWYMRESDGLLYSHLEDETSGSATFSPVYGVSGYLAMWVKDEVGTEEYFTSPTFAITGAPGPLVCDVNYDRSIVPIGTPVTADWSVSGWEPPYSKVVCLWRTKIAENSYSFTAEDETGGKASFTPVSGVSGQFLTFVTDVSGNTKEFHADDFLITAAQILAGDADGNGEIDIMDLVAIIDYIVSDTPPKSLANADANEDGTVDIMDLVWVIDKIVGG